LLPRVRDRASDIAIYQRPVAAFEVRIDDGGEEAVSVGSGRRRARSRTRMRPGGQARSDGGQDASRLPSGDNKQSGRDSGWLLKLASPVEVVPLADRVGTTQRSRSMGKVVAVGA
jgi:hypothetical protein